MSVCKRVFVWVYVCVCLFELYVCVGVCMRVFV